MKSLLLVRHAKSDWGDNTVKDFDRELNLRGRRTAPKMANHLKVDGFMPDLILSSPAQRAKCTTRHIMEQLDFDTDKLLFENDIYEASVRVLLRIINELPDNCDTVALVGHNPSLSYLAELITEENIGNIPTFGVVKINFDFGQWKMVSQATGELEYFIYPKMFDY